MRFTLISIPVLTLIACSAKVETTPKEDLTPVVTIEPETPTAASISQPNAGTTLLTEETPVVTPMDPVEPTPIPEPIEAEATLVESQLCTGRGEPALTHSTRIDFYSDNSRIYHFTLWNREQVIENFEAVEAPEASIDYLPRTDLVGYPVSSKVQHGFTEGYREFLGYSSDANLYMQLFLWDDRGGLELRVGQTGDQDKPEFFGLDAARCIKL